MKRYSILIIIGLLVALFSCNGEKVSDEQEYLKWINEEHNGLIKNKIIGEYKISVRYIPAEYQVYRELKGKPYTQKDIDSLMKYYRHAMTFLLTISPSDKKLNKSEGDVMYNDVSNLSEYNVKSYNLNFQMQDYVKINTNQKTYLPTLSAMENIYSLGNQRSVSLVFTEEKDKELTQASEYDFVFQDEIFGTGISHFYFDQKSIQALPSITFWQIL